MADRVEFLGARGGEVDLMVGDISARRGDGGKQPQSTCVGAGAEGHDLASPAPGRGEEAVDDGVDGGGTRICPWWGA